MEQKLVYDENSIIALNWRDGIRENTDMYIGNTDIMGLHHLMTEIVANSIDEAMAGYGKRIEISINSKTNEMAIQDEGRGLPFRRNQSGEYAIIEACTSNHAGGKFDGATGYKSSLGLHGLGLKLVNALSTYCQVIVNRDDGHCDIFFDNGTTDGPEIIDRKQTKTGTTVIFKPDTAIFGNLKWDLKIICEKIQIDALLNNNIEFIINVDGKLYKKYLYTEGTKDLFKIKAEGKKLVTSPVFFKTDMPDGSLEFGLAYTDDKTEDIYSYVNGGYTPNGGTHITGFKSAYTSLINKIAKKDGVLSDKDDNFTGDLVRRGLVLVLVLKANFRLAFAEQTKLTLNSPEARTLVSKATGQLELSKKQSKEILDKLLLEKKADDAAKRAKIAAATVSKGGKNLKALKDLPEKLADCPDRNGELFLCEGERIALIYLA